MAEPVAPAPILVKYLASVGFAPSLTSALFAVLANAPRLELIAVFCKMVERL